MVTGTSSTRPVPATPDTVVVVELGIPGVMLASLEQGMLTSNGNTLVNTCFLCGEHGHVLRI